MSFFSDELAHLKHLFAKDGDKLAHFLAPIISDMGKLVAADAAGDLPLAVTAVETAIASGATDPQALAGIALNAVAAIAKKQAVDIGQKALEATAAAVVAQAQSN